MLTVYKGISNAAKMPTPNSEVFLQWVMEGFATITNESNIKTFKYIDLENNIIDEELDIDDDSIVS
jgi:hypothetical protein